jgi:hypothetical protein
MKSSVLVLTIVLLCTAGERSAHADSAKPCALICLGPDETLDAKKCACVKQADIHPNACALVCLDGETLDAVKCLCVRRN